MAKMATVIGDVTGFQQHHHLQNTPHLVKKIKGFSLKAKSFRNTARPYAKVSFLCYTSYTLQRGPINPPSLVLRWGYEFACMSVCQQIQNINPMIDVSWLFKRRPDTEINLQYFTTVYTRWLTGPYKSFRLKFKDI